MKKRTNRVLSLCLALMLLLTGVPIGAKAAAGTALPTEEGFYGIQVKTYKHNTDELSVMDTYVSNGAVLEVTDQGAYAYLLLKNSDWYEYLNVGETVETLQAVVNVSGDTKVGELTGADQKQYDDDMKVVKFPVTELGKRYEGSTKITIPTGVIGIPYSHQYAIHFWLGSEYEPILASDIPTAQTLLEGQIAESETELDALQETGLYTASSINNLRRTIDFSKAVSTLAEASLYLKLVAYETANLETENTSTMWKPADVAAFGSSPLDLVDLSSYVQDTHVSYEGSTAYFRFSAPKSLVSSVKYGYSIGNVTMNPTVLMEDADHYVYSFNLVSGTTTPNGLQVHLAGGTSLPPVNLYIDKQDTGLVPAMQNVALLVDQAETRLETSQFGVWNGQYPVSSKLNLEEALKRAKHQALWTQTAAVVNGLASGLSTAINEFDASVVAGNDSDSVTMDVYYLVDRNEQNNRLTDIEAYLGNIEASQAENGANTIELSYDHEHITQIESWNGSEWQAASDVTPAGEESFRTAAFDAQSLEDAIPLRLNVDGSSREALLLFDRSNDTTALRQVVQDAVQQHAGMVAGSYYGEYLQTNKDRLMTAISTARTNGTYLHSQHEIDTALTALQNEREIAANSMRVALRSMPIAAGNDYDRVLLISGTEWLYTFTVVTEDDQKYVALRARNYGTRLNNLQYQDNGEWKPAEFVSAGSTYSTLRIPFHVTANKAADLASQVVSMRAALDGAPIDFRLLLHTTLDRTALDAAVQTATTAHGAAVVGTGAGQYPQSAKTALQTAIDAAKTKGGWLASQTNVNEAVTELNQAVTTFQGAVIGNGGSNGGGGNQPDNGGELADGYYTISYSILQDAKDDISMANGYVVSPALLHVQGTSRTVQFVVKQSAQIQYFTLNGSSENVVSQNADKNTRIVSFALPSLDDVHNGTVFIHWPEFNYNNKLYDIRFSFSESSIVKVTGTPEVPGKDVNGNVGVDDGKVDEHNGTDPGDDGKEEEGEGEEGAGNETGGNGGSGPKFSDTAKHWAVDNIEKAFKLGIVNGYDDGSFRPDDIVSRAEFAVMLGKALQLEGEADLSVFSDEASIPAWAKKYVALVTAAGAIGGFEDGTLRSNGQLSRAQLAVIVARAAGLKLDANDALDFADAAQIPAWARQEVAAAVKAGLIKGMDGNVFDPSSTATRAQALTIIMRLLETL